MIERRGRRFTGSRNAEQHVPREVQRGDPRGKTFIMVNAGHEAEDTPVIPDFVRLAEGHLLQLPPTQKLLIYLENFSGDPVTSARTTQLIEQEGMTLTEAEVQIAYESMGRRERGPRSKVAEKKAQIRQARMARISPHEQDTSIAIDNLLSTYGDQIVVVIEAQPDAVYKGNKQLYDEITTPFPADMPEEEMVALRREQIARWGDNQQEREENTVEQIVNDMGRVDVGAGIGLQGAWHHSGVDKELQQRLAPPDDPRGRNVVSVFPESFNAVQQSGEVRYPVDPTFALMRHYMNGVDIADLDILLSLQVSGINFRGRTAEQVILDDASADADPVFYDPEAPTEVFSAIFPQGPGVEYARQEQQWVRLMRGMVDKTVLFPAIEDRAKAQYEQAVRDQELGEAPTDPTGRTYDLRISEPQTGAFVLPTHEDIFDPTIADSDVDDFAYDSGIDEQTGTNTGEYTVNEEINLDGKPLKRENDDLH